MKVTHVGIPESVTLGDVIEQVRSMEPVATAEQVRLDDIDVTGRSPLTPDHLSIYQPTAVFVRGKDSSELVLLFQDEDDWKRHFGGVEPPNLTSKSGENLACWCTTMALTRMDSRGRRVDAKGAVELCRFLLRELSSRYQ